jgi:hypothetical protein
MRALKVTARVLLCLLGAVVIFAVGAFIVDYIFDARAGRMFAKIDKGVSRQSVLSQMGKPDTTRPCGKNMWWGGDGNYLGYNDGTCVSEDRYEYFLSAWGVGYTADGRAVSKYHYVSE